MAENKPTLTFHYATTAYKVPVSPSPAPEVVHITTGFNSLSKCRYGWMVYHGTDQYVGGSLKKYGEFSEGEVAMFRKLLHPGDVVIEAGANFGAHTVALGQIVGTQGCVFAFEPQPLVFQVMVANIAINSLNSVVPVHAGLGASPGAIKVPLLNPTKSLNFGGFTLGQHDVGEAVPIQTIDAMGLNRCNLIKIDVEGMEHEVIEGARDTIARLRPILYVENDKQELSCRLITLIQSLGYRLWWHTPDLFNPDNYRGDKENLFKGIVSVNMVCIPAELTIALDLVEIKTPDDDWRNAACD